MWKMLYFWKDDNCDLSFLRKQDSIFMKKNILLFLLIIGIVSPMLFSSCQRDDLCSEDPTTPRLLVGFFDFVSQEEFNRVSNLRVFEANGDADSIVITQNAVSVDSISLPLRAFTTSTRFAMVEESAIDSDGNETGNIDTITFNYTVQERFTPQPLLIKRSCTV